MTPCPRGQVSEAEVWTRLEREGCERLQPVVRSGTGTVWMRPKKPNATPTDRRRHFLLPLPDPTTGCYSERLVDDLIARLKI